MTDITKYRNVSLTHETYKTLISLSKVLLPDAKLSISKTVECLTIHQCWECESTGEIKHEDSNSYWNYTPAK